jgi:hypothetical protein
MTSRLLCRFAWPTSSAELEEKISYIHHNPVQRELVTNPLDWKWSSARWYAGIRDEHALDIDVLI